MALRTITVTQVYCTVCGWAKSVSTSEPLPSKCPAHSEKVKGWTTSENKRDDSEVIYK